MSNLKKDVGQRRSVPRVGCQEVEIGEEELAAVLLPRVISVGHENNVFLNVFLDNKPWTATEAEALSLADGVKPIAVVSANLAPRFKLNDIAFLLSEELAEKTAVIDFPRKQMPWLSRRLAGARWCVAAMRLTSSLWRCPIGSRSFPTCWLVSCARKSD